MILEILGILGIPIGLFVAWYFWTHESPRLRSNREAELDALRVKFNEAFEVRAQEIAVKAAEIALTKREDWQNENQDAPVTEPVREQIAMASATAAIEQVTTASGAHLTPMGGTGLWHLQPPFRPGGIGPR